MGVLEKISNIVRDEQNRSGALEILMPTVQPAALRHESLVVMMITALKCRE